MRKIRIIVVVVTIFLAANSLMAQSLQKMKELDQSGWCRIFDVAIDKDPTNFNEADFKTDVKGITNLNAEAFQYIEKTNPLSQKYAKVARFHPRETIVFKTWLPEAFDALFTCDCLDKDELRVIIEEIIKEILAEAKRNLENAQEALNQVKKIAEDGTQDALTKLAEAQQALNDAKAALEDAQEFTERAEAAANRAEAAANRAEAAARRAEATRFTAPTVFFDDKKIMQAIQSQIEAIRDGIYELQRQGTTRVRANEKELMFMVRFGVGVGPADMDYGAMDGWLGDDNGTTTGIGAGSGYGGGRTRTAWHDPEITFPKINFRICSLQKVEQQRKKETDIGYQGFAGWAADIEFSQTYQKGLAAGFLFHEFSSTNFIFTPGVQIFSSGKKAGLFIGIAGIGYSDNKFKKGANYFLLEDLAEAGLEWAAREFEELPQGQFNVRFETKIWPVTIKVLPVEASFWLMDNFGIYIGLSGLRLWGGESQLHISWLDEDGNEILVEDMGEEFPWLKYLQEGRLIDTGFCLIKSIELEVGITTRW